MFLKGFFSIFVFFTAMYSSVSFAKERPKKLTKEEKQIKKSQKAMWIAHILREKKDEKIIKELTLVQDKVPVFLVAQNEKFRPLVKLNFSLKKSEARNLKLLDANRLPVRYNEKTQKYSLYAYLNSRLNTVQLTAVDTSGNKKTETLYLFAPEARELNTVTIFDSIMYTIGHAYLEYEQTTFGKYVAQSLLIGAKYLSPEKGKKIGYYAEAFSTIYNYEVSPSDESANFLEARLGLTYSKKLYKTPRIRSRFMLGVNTVNLFSLREFGFSGLFGPNLGLRSEFYKSGKNSFALELQYTPYDFSDLWGERTAKVSFDWNRNLNNLRRSQIGFSYSDHTFTSTGSFKEQLDTRFLSVYYALSF